MGGLTGWLLACLVGRLVGWVLGWLAGWGFNTIEWRGRWGAGGIGEADAVWLVLGAVWNVGGGGGAWVLPCLEWPTGFESMGMGVSMGMMAKDDRRVEGLVGGDVGCITVSFALGDGREKGKGKGAKFEDMGFIGQLMERYVKGLSVKSKPVFSDADGKNEVKTNSLADDADVCPSRWGYEHSRAPYLTHLPGNEQNNC